MFEAGIVNTNLFYFFLAFAISLALTPVVRICALKNNLISFPRADRWHKHPTALLGGVSIYLATILTACIIPVHNKYVLGLFLGGTVLFIVGLIDDKKRLTPYTKLFLQIIAACIALYFGVSLGLPFSNYITLPLTLLWIVAVTNAFNLLDNIDGLAAGTAAISAGLLFLISLVFFHNPLNIYAIILAGAALGFLPYNFNPAKIFMGDSGSMFLGFSLAVIATSGTGRHMSGLFITLLLPVLVLSVPIFDMIFVMITRKLRGKPIFEGGKDHTSHRLVTLGLSQRRTVILLYAISIVFGSIAILYTAHINPFIILSVTFLAGVILLYFGLFLFEVTTTVDVNKKFTRNNGNSVILNNMFLHKRRIVEVMLDLIFICIAYYAAYFFRFEGHTLSSSLVLLKDSILWIIAIKMSVFFIFGLYRGVWKYISIYDLLTIAKVVTLGSIASILFLTFAFRFQEYSRKVFFIDWLILLFLIMGSRILFRVIGEFLNRVREKGTNIIIVGAGDTGEMVVREIKRNKLLRYNPVGFVDDDSFKIGTKIQGIPVLGTRERLQSLIQELAIKEVFITIPKLHSLAYEHIITVCKENNIPYRFIKGILEE